ncbi:hypothetical protein O0L34_g11581 [Tuta absoluta]|nr:hypothetical protein O0L34_g11581 [Tuta absoluta]
MSANKEECHQLLSSDAFGCCKTYVAENNQFGQVQGCETKPPPSCEGVICAAKQHGLTTADDGTFNKEAMEAFIRKMVDDSPEFADSVVNTCVNGDISSYGPAEYCDLIKFKQCLLVTYLSKCSDWKETDVCSEVKMQIDQCVS